MCSCFLLKCKSTFQMDWIKWMLTTFMLFKALSVCHANKNLIETAAVGQDVVIPCRVQVKGPFERLVWKEDVNRIENLAHSFEGSLSCDTRKKQNCSLRSDGSLELPNVQETDSGDYFCVRGIDEKYYSQHTLAVHPEVAFETCPNSEDVFVTQTGPDEIVFAYTIPVCKNTDAIGTVTCDPPSGAKIGFNVTEIVCNCIHSGNVVDTCEIPIPDVTPSYENCSGSYFVCGSEAVTIVRAPVTASGIFLGIFIGAVLGGVGNLIQYFYIKHSQKQSSDKQKNAELKEMLKKTVSTESSERCTPQRYTDGNKEHTKPEFTTCLQPNMTTVQGEPLELECSVNVYPNPTILEFKDGKQLDPKAGYKTTFSEELAMLTAKSTKEDSTVTVPPSDDNGTLAEVCSDVTGINTAVDTPDTQDSIPCCTEIRQLVVEDISEKFTILPSRTNPTGGIAVSCYRDENLTVGFHTGDLSTFPKLTLDPLNGGMTLSVSDKVAVPLHINCLDCGINVCTLEVNSSEWSKEEPETDCTTTYQCI